MTARPSPRSKAPTPAQRRRALALFDALAREYPDAHCELTYSNPHELLVATILSAQSTDVGVNKATPALFKRFPTPADYAAATPAEIETYIKSIGLFRNKARAIHAAMTELVRTFGGSVPRTMSELLTLRGVARKTANVVLGNAFNLAEGFVVDTHIERLAKRFALADPADNVAAVERKLMAMLPPQRWCAASHELIFHGRRVCKARLPACAEHPICREFGDRCELRITAPAQKKKPAPRARASKSARSTGRPRPA